MIFLIQPFPLVLDHNLEPSYQKVTKYLHFRGTLLDTFSGPRHSRAECARYLQNCWDNSFHSRVYQPNVKNSNISRRFSTFIKIATISSGLQLISYFSYKSQAKPPIFNFLENSSHSIKGCTIAHIWYLQKPNLSKTTLQKANDR